jgi:hypothetical protein
MRSAKCASILAIRARLAFDGSLLLRDNERPAQSFSRTVPSNRQLVMENSRSRHRLPISSNSESDVESPHGLMTLRVTEPEFEATKFVAPP